MDQGTNRSDRGSLFRRLANRIWGYDFFISYRWSAGGPYAVSLSERLRDTGYECFLDRSEFAVGDDWKKQGEVALRNTHRLVVIATRDAIENSAPVRHEIDVFVSRSHRVIPIVFGERFTDEEHERFPTLRSIPESTIDIIEDPDRQGIGPSDDVLDKLVQAHKVLRRRSVRVLAVLAAFSVLAAAAAVAGVFWWQAEQSQREEFRQKLHAQSLQNLNKAELLRETQGPKLEQSLDAAAVAYGLAEEAGESTAAAAESMRKALDLLPERVGESWLPFGSKSDVKLSSADRRAVFTRRVGNRGYDVVVAELDQGGAWHVVRRFNEREHGRVLGVPGPRWLVTEREGELTVWDILGEGANASIPIGDAEFVALSPDGRRVLVRQDEGLEIRDGKDPSAQPGVLPLRGRYWLHAFSPDGQLLACARQNDLAVVRVADGKVVLRGPITTGGGHERSLGFLGKDAIYAVWSEGQVMAMAPSRRGGPRHLGGVWKLGRSVELGPPDIPIVREGPFRVEFAGGGPGVFVVLEEGRPVQWTELQSNLSVTLGGRAGAGKEVAFGSGGSRLLIVHIDGSARLWNIEGQKELLRVPAEDELVDADFLKQEGGATRIVSVESSGRVQAWTSTPTDARVEDYTKGRRIELR